MYVALTVYTLFHMFVCACMYASIGKFIAVHRLFACCISLWMEKINTNGRGSIIIIESVDSISRDGPDTPIIYVTQVHYKTPKISEEINFEIF